MFGTKANVASPIAKKYLGLSLSQNVGPIILGRLMERFGSIDAVLSADDAQLRSVDGVGPKVSAGIRSDAGRAAAKADLKKAAAQGIRIICVEDADYPRPLLQMPDAPLCLYLHGNLLPTDAVAIGVVGSRKCSHYGLEQARRFSAGLAELGFAIVSGLARGVDGHAHKAAIDAGGRTIAVLGNGLSSIYPPEHAALADEIAAHGAVVSELTMDTEPLATNFPGRNRIITGLSLGVLVVEAGKQSGALITARLAADYNREVFAVPGRVDADGSVGTNQMIRDGHAKLVTCVGDVLDELGEVGELMRNAAASPAESKDGQGDPTAGANVQLSAAERTVLGVVSDEGEILDQITSATKLPAGQVASALTMLEAKALIQRLPGGRYARRSRRKA